MHKGLKEVGIRMQADYTKKRSVDEKIRQKNLKAK